MVYVVRRGEQNEELRYALRSLANVPHGRVWIVGYRPSWVQGVEFISVRQLRSKHANAKANIRAAVDHPDVAERFLYCNDDFFVMRPVDEIPALHRGLIANVVRNYPVHSDYTEAMDATRRILADLGCRRPLSYELHVPMLVTKAGLQRALDLARHDRVQERSLYGNLGRIGGRRVEDCKVYGGETGWERWAFLSTDDAIFAAHPVGRFIRARFPEPSPYEGDRIDIRL